MTKVWIPVVVLGASLVVAGAASAALSATGIGATTVKTGTFVAPTVEATVAGDTPNSLLQPGGTADVLLRVHNSNTVSAHVVAVALNGTITATGGIGSCTNPGVSFTNQTGLSISVAAGTTVVVDLPAAASMSTSAPSGCQGASFSIPVALSSVTP